MNAIKSGKIKANRTNSGWIIDPEDLEKWQVQGGKTVMTDESQAVMDLRLELAELKGELKGSRELVEVLKEELRKAREPFWRRWIG